MSEKRSVAHELSFSSSVQRCVIMQNGVSAYPVLIVRCFFHAKRSSSLKGHLICGYRWSSLRQRPTLRITQSRSPFGPKRLLPSFSLEYRKGSCHAQLTS